MDVVHSENQDGFLDASTEPGKKYYYRVSILDDGNPVASFETDVTTPAGGFTLVQNRPNPFNPSTVIDFSLNQRGPVSLLIYDVAGKPVRTLVSGVKTAGQHSKEWDGRDNQGKQVPSGV